MTGPASAQPTRPVSSASMKVEFHEDNGTHSGDGSRGRQWRITQSRTGWRLEFQDEGDAAPTYAGNHASLDAAKREAAK